MALFRFKTPQRIFQIGKLRIGGQPGELPTLLIGSIFYKGHKIVSDPKKGIFEKEAAEKLIKRQEELSDMTGNPCMLDVVINSSEAVDKYLDFVSNITDNPFVFDAWPLDVRINGLKYVNEVGLNDRIVYDSISPIIKEEELNAIKESKIKTAIILVWNFKDPWVKGLLVTLKGLLNLAEESGLEKPLIDFSPFTIPHIGVVSRAVYLAKEEYGLPTGCGPGNATTKWTKSKREWGSDVHKACESSLHTIAIALGANFLFYAPIESADWIFPSCALADASIATASKELGTRILLKEHPVYKLFPQIARELEKTI